MKKSLELSVDEKIIKEQLEKLTQIKDKIFVSYSGKPGCMCGCLGKYNYKESFRSFAGKNRGYEISDDEISDVAVSRMINKFRKLLESGVKLHLIDDYGKDHVGNFFYETPTRYNAIYFKAK